MRFTRGSEVCTRALLAAALACLVRTAAWAQPTSIDDVVILARTEARFEANVNHVSGQIVVNDPGGRAMVHQLFRTLPDLQPQLVADNVSVMAVAFDGPELFDVFTNTITDPAGNAIILGTVTQPLGASLPLLPYPTPVAVTPGTENLRVTRTTSPVTLPPGDYGDIRIASGGALYFAGGTYNIRSLRAGSRSLVFFNGATTLNIAVRARFGSRSNVGPADPAVSGRCVTINVAGEGRMRMGRVSEVNAIINAPAAILRLGLLGDYRGTFTADRVAVGRGAVLQPLPPLTEACP